MPEQNPRDPINALFNSLFALPKSIYNRGNEHGRAFTRRHHYENDDGERPRPRSARRECARWEGQGYRGQDNREEHVPAKDTLIDQAVIKPEEISKDVAPKVETEVDDWVQKIIGELERGEKEARQLYEQWMAVADSKTTCQESGKEDAQQGNTDAELTTQTKAPERPPWVDIFPSWSAEGHKQGQGHGNHHHVFTNDVQQPHRSQTPVEAVDGTLDNLHKNLGRRPSEAARRREGVQESSEGDSRQWQDGAIFGPSNPFLHPLNTLFSLGLQHFLPEQSAIGYLLYSEYSPLHLEHEDGFDSSFRQRFEDLLRAENGKAMMSEEECASGNTTSFFKWLGRVVPLLKEDENSGASQRTFSIASVDPSVLQVVRQKTLGQEPYDGPATEQDMYDQHFSNFPREPFQIPSVPRSVLPESENRSSRPSILSTMTRTERHVAPDGSVTTKTVLKKRFTDGSEENSETTETRPATGPVWREQRPEVERGLDSEIARSKPMEDQEPKRGWFWSS